MPPPGGTFEVEDPATGKPLTTVSEGRAADMQMALESARDTFEDGTWARADPRDRAAVMNKAAAMLAERVGETAELGKVVTVTQSQPVSQADTAPQQQSRCKLAGPFVRCEHSLGACQSGLSTMRQSFAPRVATRRPSRVLTSTMSTVCRWV